MGRGGLRSLANAPLETVRVFFYRQHKPDGTVVEAYWLTNFLSSTVGPQTLFRMAKSRWEIENQGFNEAKSRHGLEHICHHHANSLLIEWLLAMLALTIERLYRLRFLHRGKHPVPSSAQLLLHLWLQSFPTASRQQQLTPSRKTGCPLFPRPTTPHR